MYYIMANSNIFVPNIDNIYAQSITFSVTEEVFSTPTLSYNPEIDPLRPEWIGAPLALLSDVNGEGGDLQEQIDEINLELGVIDGQISALQAAATTDTNPIVNNIVVYADTHGDRKTANTTAILNQPLSLGSTLGVNGMSTLASVSATSIAGSSLNIVGISTLAGVSATSITDTGTLGVSGLSTLAGITNSSTLVNTGLITANGGIGTTNLTTSGTASVGTNLTVTGTTNTGTTNTGALSATSFIDTGNATVQGTLGVTGTTTLGTVNAGVLTASGVTATGGFSMNSGVFSVTTSGGSTPITFSTPGVPTFQIVNSSGSNNVTDGMLMTYEQAVSTLRIFNWIQNNSSSGSFSASMVYGKGHTSGSIGWETGIDPTQAGVDQFGVKCLSQGTIPFIIANTGNATHTGSVTGKGFVASSSAVTGDFVAFLSSVSSTGRIRIRLQNIFGTVGTSNIGTAITFGPASGNGAYEQGNDASQNGGDNLYWFSSTSGSQLLLVTPTLWTIQIPTTINGALTVSGLITANGGVSSTTLSASSTLNVTGVSTLANVSTKLITSATGMSLTSQGSNPGGTATLYLNSSDPLRPFFGSNKLALYSDIPVITTTTAQQSFSITSTFSPASNISVTFALAKNGYNVTLQWPTTNLGTITSGTTGLIFSASSFTSTYLPTNNIFQSITLLVNNQYVPGYLETPLGTNFTFYPMNGVNWSGTCSLVGGCVTWQCSVA